MAESNQQEKTEKATPKKRQQAREEGQIAKSREVVSTSLFLGNILFFSFAGAYLFRQVVELMQSSFTTLGEVEVSVDGVYLIFMHYLSRTTTILLPFFLTVLVFAVASNMLQSGVLFAPKALKPKWSQLNPLNGFKRMFSMQLFNELFKSLVKIGVVGYIVYTAVTSDLGSFFALTGQSVEEIFAYVGSSSLRLGTHALYALIGMAILDFSFQRWQYEKNLRMSVQETKDERKREDGDPQIRSRIRSVMREMARKRMMEDVPTADVVVTNPTHVAVALRYNRDEMPAPKVVAKGTGYIAERIKASAQEHGIPLVENKPVARSLYKAVEVGHVIPEALYKAVAEILAYVYRLKPRRTV